MQLPQMPPTLSLGLYLAVPCEYHTYSAGSEERLYANPPTNPNNSPLFTTYMYKNLGTQWASSVPAFLALFFAPLPFIFLRVGAKLRAHSKFANEAKTQLAKLMEVRQQVAAKFEAKSATAEEDAASGSKVPTEAVDAGGNKE